MAPHLNYFWAIHGTTTGKPTAVYPLSKLATSIVSVVVLYRYAVRTKILTLVVPLLFHVYVFQDVCNAGAVVAEPGEAGGAAYIPDHSRDAEDAHREVSTATISFNLVNP